MFCSIKFFRFVTTLPNLIVNASEMTRENIVIIFNKYTIDFFILSPANI